MCLGWKISFRMFPQKPPRLAGPRLNVGQRLQPCFGSRQARARAAALPSYGALELSMRGDENEAGAVDLRSWGFNNGLMKQLIINIQYILI